MDFNDAQKVILEGRLNEQTDAQLDELSNAYNRHLASRQFIDQCKNGIKSIQAEKSSRKDKQTETEITGRQDESAANQIAINKSLLALKNSVDDLAKPHWVLWATLIITTIGSTASVIGYWPQIAAFVQFLIHGHSSGGTP